MRGTHGRRNVECTTYRAVLLDLEGGEAQAGCCRSCRYRSSSGDAAACSLNGDCEAARRLRLPRVPACSTNDGVRSGVVAKDSDVAADAGGQALGEMQ